MNDQYGRGKIKYWRWNDGRQGSGYKIFYMWNWKFDFLIIRYPVGSYIHWHRDPVPEGLNHHRINVTFRHAKIGGWFIKSKNKFPLKPGGTADWLHYKEYFHKFRPDIEWHSVSEIEHGERWVLSLGWCTKQKEIPNEST